jgi:hypothetical protein
MSASGCATAGRAVVDSADVGVEVGMEVVTEDEDGAGVPERCTTPLFARSAATVASCCDMTSSYVGMGIPSSTKAVKTSE